MATQKRGSKSRASGSRRPASQPRSGATPPPSSGGSGSSVPRRLGQQPQRPRSQGAQRRAQRARRPSGALLGWLAVGVVVVVVLVFVLVKVTGGGSPKNATGDAAGRNPATASASIVDQLESTPLSVQSAAGIGTQTKSPYELVAGNHPLTSTVSGSGSGGRSSSTGHTVPRIVFVGAEFCPYCAVERYALILGLSRLGTFHNLKVTASASTDGDIPTFSLLGSSYTSPYVALTAYEDEDRNHNSLDPPPLAIQKLWVNQDTAATGSPGYPYMNFAGKFALLNFPTGLDQTLGVLEGNNGSGAGISRSQIISGVHTPSSSFGSLIDATAILSEANYVDAAVCSVDGGRPAGVCQASGVKAAMAVLAKTPATKLPA